MTSHSKVYTVEYCSTFKFRITDLGLDPAIIFTLLKESIKKGKKKKPNKNTFYVSFKLFYIYNFCILFYDILFVMSSVLKNRFLYSTQKSVFLVVYISSNSWKDTHSKQDLLSMWVLIFYVSSYIVITVSGRFIISTLRYVTYNVVKQGLSSTIFWVFGIIRPGIEPQSPGPLANTLPTKPMP